MVVLQPALLPNAHSTKHRAGYNSPLILHIHPCPSLCGLEPVHAYGGEGALWASGLFCSILRQSLCSQGSVRGPSLLSAHGRPTRDL